MPFQTYVITVSVLRHANWGSVSRTNQRVWHNVPVHLQQVKEKTNN